MIKKQQTLSFLIFLISCIHALNSITIGKRFAVVSPPKCGTHLLINTMQLISRKRISYATGPGGWTIIDQKTIDDLLKKSFLLKTHALYIPDNINKLDNYSIKTCFIYRDPRDQIVSAAFWIKKSKNEWPYHSQLDLDVLIDQLISDGGEIWGTIFNGKEVWNSMKGIVDFYNLYLPWCNEKFVYTTTFEKLVGPRGGGSLEDQINEIMAIARHMGEPITIAKAHLVAQQSFGNTMTFREGEIGSWKKYFLPWHKEKCKKVAGQLLIDLGYEKDKEW